MSDSTPQPPVVSAVTAAPRRRVWPWILALVLAPFLIVAAGLASFVTLDRDAAALRGIVMRATGADWNTRVQASLGRATLDTVRTGLRFSSRPEVGEARLALGALRSASVGVYQHASLRGGTWSATQVLADTDRAMQKRGWSRLVGVVSGEETVMIYVPADGEADEPLDFCVAVVTGRELVVLSATLEPGELSRLVARHADADLRADLRRHLRF